MVVFGFGFGCGCVLSGVTLVRVALAEGRIASRLLPDPHRGLVVEGAVGGRTAACDIVGPGVADHCGTKPRNTQAGPSLAEELPEQYMYVYLSSHVATCLHTIQARVQKRLPRDLHTKNGENTQRRSTDPSTNTVLVASRWRPRSRMVKVNKVKKSLSKLHKVINVIKV